MGVAQAGQIAVFPREFAQAAQHLHQLLTDQLERVPQHQYVRVVGDVAGGRAQVDDAPGARTHVPVGVDVGHHVVAHPLLVPPGVFIVDILDVGLQLVHLFPRHRQAQLHLALRQRHPQLPPGGEFLVGRKDVLHLRRGIPAVQGRFVGRFVHKKPPVF